MPSLITLTLVLATATLMLCTFLKGVKRIIFITAVTLLSIGLVLTYVFMIQPQLRNLGYNFEGGDRPSVIRGSTENLPAVISKDITSDGVISADVSMPSGMDTSQAVGQWRVTSNAGNPVDVNIAPSDIGISVQVDTHGGDLEDAIPAITREITAQTGVSLSPLMVKLYLESQGLL